MSKIIDAEDTPFERSLRESMEKIKNILGEIKIEVGVTGEPQIVEGSIVEPVTDPTRLLEAEHAILPKGTELTPGRELAFDLPITIMRD